MASLTIRRLDDPIKALLRERAAASRHSMEEEARQILRNALLPPAEPPQDLVSRIRARFAELGDVVLDIPVREAVREPPVLGVVSLDDGAQ